MLDAVAMPSSSAHRYPHEISGGQSQRVAIARALSTKPRLVICDEAVSALDKTVQAQVLNVLADLQRATGTAYLFISHDLAVVEHMADTVAVMRAGEIVEVGTAERIWSEPQHEYTRQLIDSVPGTRPS
jgi:peptide/nickel transport system ATP-binding protein/oligopeptide transport system ATP-binding protein